ncbi:MAG: sigma-70 family RNA polymerase sigma factor [Ardenticatenia bacterium]|nr:MAG: sigma-70 family RNA polymerase sigma factor [Ardenticatenia bacterium]
MTHSVSDDAVLAQRVADGDRQAFLALYDRYAARVYGLALRMLGEHMAAEEVTQDTFLKLWTRADTYSPRKGALAAWLLTIARRTALDRIRLENRRPEFGEYGDPEDAWQRLPDPRSNTPESRWRDLHFALLDLPEEQRRVIELAYYHGMSQSQIAAHLEIPLGTVKTRLRLGMEKLRRSWLAERSDLDENGVNSIRGKVSDEVS